MGIINEYLEGESLRDLSKKYNVTHISIRNKLLELGVKLRPHGTHTSKSIAKWQKSRQKNIKEIGRKISKAVSGPKNPNWKDGIESTNGKIVREIFKKYNGICQDCGNFLKLYKKNSFEAHHLNTTLFKTNYKKYMTTKNRILLCLRCHRKRHKELRKNATVAQ